MSLKLDENISQRHEIGLNRTFLYCQNIDELDNLLPINNLDTSHVDIISGDDLVKSIHSLTTEGGDTPYKNSLVTVENIKDHSKISFTQTYLQEGRINNLIYLAMSLRQLGVDIFHLNGIVTARDENNDQIAKISPPVIEVNSKGEYKLISGHQRFFTAYLLGSDIDVVTIRNFDENHARPYEPINFYDVKLAKSPPPIEQRRTLITGHSDLDFIDFTAFGEDGKRRNRIQSEISFFPINPTEGPKSFAKKMRHQVNKLLHSMNPNSLHFSGLFPSAIGTPESVSRTEKLANVRQIDDKHLLATLNIDMTGKDGYVRNGIYYSVCKTEEASIKTQARKIVILEPDISLPINVQPRPDGEIILPDEIYVALNQQLLDRGLRPFTNGFVSSKSNPGTPIVSKFEFIDDGKKFHTEIILTLDNGHRYAYVLNRQDEKDDKLISGSVFIIRDNQNNIVFVEQYRELFGMRFLQLPRMHGFSLQRLEKEIGYHIMDSELTEGVSISESRDVLTSDTKIFFAKLTNSAKSNNSFTLDEYPENSDVIHLSDQYIHDLITGGKLHCKITNAAITLDQITNHKVIINPEYQNQTIVLEKFYCVPDGKYYLRPVATESNPNQRISQNQFSNTGVLLDYDHVELGNIDELPPDKSYLQVPISDIFNLMINGALDSDAIADISTGLRHQGVIILKPSIP